MKLKFTWIGRLVGRFLSICALAIIGVSGASAQQRGGTLNSTLWPEPPGIVIGIHLNAPTLLPSTKIFEGLLTYDFQLNPQPMLAETWKVSDDGLTYTFNLRHNVKWHDGKPFTSKDVVFSLSKFIPEVHPRSKPTFQRAEVTAPDDFTVVIKLKEPYGPMIRSFDAISAPIVPAHIYEGTNFKDNPANRHPTGTGPFKFDEWKSGQYIHLVRNNDYYLQGKPYLDDIYYRFIPDSASRALALEQGEVQLATQNDIELVDVARLAKLSTLDVTTKGWEWGAPISWLEMNLRRKPFNDVRFRKAVMYALDRNFIRNSIFFGVASPATGPIHSSSPFYTSDVQAYPHDVAKAKALLDEMGLKPDGDGVRVKIGLLGLPYGELWDRLSQYIKQALGQVGVEVTIQTADVAGWGNRIANWDVDMSTTYLTTLSDPALGVARSYITENQKKGVLFTNTAGYSNPEVDKLFADAAKEPDQGKRKAMYAKVQKTLVDDVALGWLVELQWPTITSKKLKNVVRNGLGPNDNFSDVYFEK
jgi:peptide/nickel transport system substrate-binding protein